MDRRFASLALLLMLTSAAFAGQSSDRRFLAGLRQRGLFRLAETYCTDRLKRPDLPESERADLVIELSHTLAERAVGSPPEVRPVLWQRALTVTEDFARQYPQSPRLPLVRLQGALGLLTRGELARQEAEVLAGREELLDEAKSHLRSAIRRLGELAEEVDRRLRERSLSGRGDPAELTADQLLSLKKNIRYQLARAYRNQAQCYTSDSPDRTNALTQTVKLLEPLAKLDVADPLAFKSRLDLIVTRRLLADYDTARLQLDALLREQLPPAVQLRARAEWIHLALASGRLSEAISVLAKGRDVENVTSAELDHAWLRTHLAAWRTAAEANHSKKAAEWQAKATAMVRRIGSLHGPYWTRRAEMLLAGYVRSAPESGNLAMLVHAAESAFRSGRFHDALDAYDRARQFAQKQGDANRAFDLAYVAATIEHQRGRHEQALARYRQIAKATPNHAKAPEAHLLAIYHAGRLAKESPKDSLRQYEDLLEEHLRFWPRGPGADRVHRQLGRLLEYRHQWKRAIGEYRAVSHNDAEYVEAIRAAARCYQAWLDERKAAGESTGRIAADATEAAGWFESLIIGQRQQLPERWSPAQRFAALAAARLRLNFTADADGYLRAQNVLSAALEGATKAPPKWRSAARALLVVSLAGQGRVGEADKLLKQISRPPPEAMLDVLQGLGRLAAEAKSQDRAQLAELQLTAEEMLRGHEDRLTESENRALRRVRAQALADAGRTEKALAAFRSLAADYPRDGAIQEAYARLLLSRSDPQSLKQALQKWRELENNSPPQSPRWFRAKYQVAWVHYKLGNKQQAAKIITLLRLLHPEMGGSEMQAKFEQLEEMCRQ